MGVLLCMDCGAHLPSAPTKLHGIISCLDYKDTRVRKLVAALKFRGAYKLALPLGSILFDRILEELGEEMIFSGNITSRKMILVPVPLSVEKRRTRGYNQTEELARALALYDGGQMFTLETGALVKIRDTESQVSQGKRESRLTNLKDAFQADANIVANKHIILLDDVATTGATISECRRALSETGALSITAITLAH